MSDKDYNSDQSWDQPKFKFLPSRQISAINAPEVDGQYIKSQFVYNFFVADETINDSGVAQFQGGLSKGYFMGDQNSPKYTDNLQGSVTPEDIRSQVPRFVLIEFSPPFAPGIQDPPFDGIYPNVLQVPGGTKGFLSLYKSNINTEETYSSTKDAPLQTRDLNVRERLKSKLAAFAFLDKPSGDLTSQKILNSASKINGLDTKVVEGLLAEFEEPGIIKVNELREIERTVTYKDVADANISSFVDKRVGPLMLNPPFRKKMSNLKPKSMLVDHYTKFNQIIMHDGFPQDLEPSLNAIKATFIGSNTNANDTVVSYVGYIVKRREVGPTGLFDEETSKEFYLDGMNKTNFFDTQVLYGKEYEYTIRTVYLMRHKTHLNYDAYGVSGVKGTAVIYSLIASKPSQAQYVTCVERVPPKSPDGVFYRFNYSAGNGLLINWQIPVGKQRDIKYFQVFRRRTIKDPFQCIAELDFNDALHPPSRPESVREDRRYSCDSVKNYFEDAHFYRGDSYIYAIAAVDAHGLSSGYSAQTRVGFNLSKNEITLETISRPDAPKQYPNIFIDPLLDDNFAIDSLTVDSMQVSKKQEIRVYFDPDALAANIQDPADEKAGSSVKIVSFDASSAAWGTATSAGGTHGDIVTSEGKYAFSLLNIDRQLSETIDFGVKDYRSQVHAKP